MHTRIWLSAAALAFASAAQAAYSFDDIASGNWGYYYVPAGGTPPYTASAENTVLANLSPISAIEIMVYNPTGTAITGASVTLSVLDSSATNPNPGGPGNVLLTQTLSLPSLAATTYYDISVPVTFTPTNTNIWTAFSFSNSSVATLINLTGPSIGSASATTFAVDLVSGGWNDNYELTNGSGSVIPPYFGIRYDIAPAPVSVALLGLGVAGLVARKRRAGA